MPRPLLTALLVVGMLAVQAQNPLFIPPVLSGTNFNLTIAQDTTQFFPGVNTLTYGINGKILGPTLLFNKWDWITLNVTNNLPGNGNSTTMHWHGLHVPAMADGGPHQVIGQNSTWSPHFQVMNDAGTFWYHPHGQNKTDRHVSKGLAGMIIIRDSTEAALSLPRNYGVDDIPVIIQTKAFDVLNQIAIATALDTLPMVNATVNAYWNAPAQVVRLRLLNGASDRSFQIGFSNNMNFSLIATDGGLLDSATTLNRLCLSNGERAEILLDLSGRQGDTIYLMSYGSELPSGVIGAAQVGMGMAQIPDYNLNPLNGADYTLLKLIVGPPTVNPVMSIPASLVSLNPLQAAQATVSRTLQLTLDSMNSQNMAEGPFTINGRMFDMDSIDQIVYLNDIELWTLNNQTLVAHPFHIHDVQFYVLNVNGAGPPAYLRGKKDVVLVMPQQTVTFITKFQDFADATTPYMYHCHLLHHEDDGMMGSFVVVDTTATGIKAYQLSVTGPAISPNPVNYFLRIEPMDDEPYTLSIVNAMGEKVYTASAFGSLKLPFEKFAVGMYILHFQSASRSFTKKIIKQ
jgi:bilirubin oxidase